MQIKKLMNITKTKVLTLWKFKKTWFIQDYLYNPSVKIFYKLIWAKMAKGKRTYVAFYSTETGNMVHTTNIQKRN